MNKSAFLITFIGLYLAVKAINTQQGNTNSLIYLGTANGSSFFADNTQMRSWTEAKQFCNESGMRLANLNTAEQITILRQHNITGAADGVKWWTAGRDARTPSQFVWDNNGETPNTEIIDLFYAYEATTCLYFYNYTSGFGSYACEQPNHTLCEVVL